MAPDSRSEDTPPLAPGAAAPFSGTVTIFFSDIRGFTDYTEQFGDEAAFRILREHNAIARKQIEAFGGVVVKTQGDSFMVAFTTARRAILCAIAIQRAIDEANRSHVGPQIAVGIGINTGEPIQEGGDYFGSTVNLAARICAAAGPGQILVAETTRYVAGRIESVDYVDRGLHQLKGFPEARRLCEVVWREPARAAPATGGELSPGSEEQLARFRGVVQYAIGVLTRVLAVSHLDDPAFGPLLECQAKASDLRLMLSRASAERSDVSASQVEEAILPFESLVALVQQRDDMSEERWAQLEQAVSGVFGRSLVTSAARGRLSIGSLDRVAPTPTARAPGAPPERRTPAVTKPAVPSVDSRGAGVRWWVGAFSAWSHWKASGIGWAHAVRGELGRHPHFLGVPIQESADEDDGQLAGSYFVLLEHVENQSPSFMNAALEQAIAAVGGSLEPEVLGPKLYDVLVAGGRLRETYGALVRRVVGVGIPNPGVWADGGVIEHEDVTVAIVRPSGFVGDMAEQTVELTEAAERAADHSFMLTVQPLTARFFYVKPGELKTPRDLALRLVVDGEPSDQAWYVTLRTSLVVRSEPQLLPPEGLMLPGLGRDHGGAWVAIFNPSPDSAAACELTVTLRPAPPAPKWAPFRR